MRALAFLLLLQTMAYGQSFSDQVDKYFDDIYFHYTPTAGTQAGFHQYDTQLEDYSRAAVDAHINDLHRAEKQFTALATKTQEEQGDRDLILNDIRSTLLELETVRGWEKNPDRYSSGISGSAFAIISRTFAPPEDRLRSLIARERQMPAVFEAARENLKNPPQIYTEVAIEQLPGIISFFQNDVPLAFQKVTDQKLLTDFHHTNTLSSIHSSNIRPSSRQDLLPQSQRRFSLGR